jgi:predicted SprT family Zn-dependent metalloprotease
MSFISRMQALFGPKLVAFSFKGSALHSRHLSEHASGLDDIRDPATSTLLQHYIERLGLSGHPLRATDDRATFQRWLGRRVNAQIGGAFVFLTREKTSLILINAVRIDLSKPRSLEIVVAEETLHMRDWLDGDRRRHARHGYDRIAYRVAQLTGASIDEVRSCLLPAERRPFKYEYACPRCGVVIRRRLKGTWSCRRCAPKFDQRCVFRLVREL